ncbi:metal ABC transporter substrate-binding protein [uncultured Intestinimonas sp.]|uniref:metal ABC transporter substrate-binding protein n=1 Tax=uncultured Intestinimonas sp. TaxID=1689265 RepID=UPI0029439877|nr:metal ABC transporter substrate-binding protein [uncultured Intestinimonas sp.]
MKKIMLSLLLSGLLFLTACGGGAAAGPAPAAEDEPLRILATTYPVYLFTTAVTDGVEGVEVTRLIKEEISCLHDYTLTVNDMKAIEAADVIVMNGVGLEDFMEDALASSDAPVIDCSEGVELLAALGHEGHDHDTEYDPHIWMDPERAGRMIENIGAGLSQADPDRAETYAAQAAEAAFQLQHWYSVKLDVIASDQPDLQLPHRALITFHDGFQYFADAFQLDLLKAIEEEEGAEASAAEIKEIVELIGEHDLPVIFTEKNGSDATAQAIARETGVAVAQLDMVMSGDGTGLEAYSAAMDENIKTIINALSEGRIRAE